MAATILSPSAIFSSSPTTTPKATPISSTTAKSPAPLVATTAKPICSAAAAAAAAVLLSATAPSLADPSTSFHVYYGTAASAANYGGFGGNSSKKDSAEYIYDVPDGWKERLVSKVDKGTNGTDSEFYNPKKRAEREYLTFLAGFRQLAPIDTVLNNLALSDVDLQDLISSADSVRSEERKDGEGQVYYVYEIDGAGAHSLISVTCAKNKLYAHFVNAPNPEWNRDQETLKHIHRSFKTVKLSSQGFKSFASSRGRPTYPCEVDGARLVGGDFILACELAGIHRSVFQDVCDPITGTVLTGSWVWDSAVYLSKWIVSQGRVEFQIEGKTVVELGAGTGLPRLVAASLGAALVILTDIAAMSALLGLQRSVEANGFSDRVEVRELLWGWDEFSLGVVDLVLMSDVFYDPSEMPVLAKTLKGLCGRETRIWAVSEVWMQTRIGRMVRIRPGLTAIRL